MRPSNSRCETRDGRKQQGRIRFGFDARVRLTLRGAILASNAGPEARTPEAKVCWEWLSSRDRPLACYSSGQSTGR